MKHLFEVYTPPHLGDIERGRPVLQLAAATVTTPTDPGQVRRGPPNGIQGQNLEPAIPRRE